MRNNFIIFKEQLSEVDSGNNFLYLTKKSANDKDNNRIITTVLL